MSFRRAVVRISWADVVQQLQPQVGHGEDVEPDGVPFFDAANDLVVPVIVTTPTENEG